jgi:hypothetical protein
MSRKLYAFRDGLLIDVSGAPLPPCGASAFIQDDTMAPLRHPVTSKYYDSKSEYIRDTKRMGMEIMGEEKHSEKPQILQETITEPLIMDRIERAEAIVSDPAKFRARLMENQERLARRERYLNNGN